MALDFDEEPVCRRDGIPPGHYCGMGACFDIPEHPPLPRETPPMRHYTGQEREWHRQTRPKGSTGVLIISGAIALLGAGLIIVACLSH